MTYYRCVGEVPRKRHAQFRGEDGRLLLEELIGEQGFFHASSLLYHLRQPNALVDVSAIDVPSLLPQSAPTSPLMPHLYQSDVLPLGGNTVTGRQCILMNDDIVVSYADVDQPSPLFRNAVGDELVFVREGELLLESQFGCLSVATGDYVRIPSGCIHRWIPGEVGAKLLILEASGHVTIPNRYVAENGQMLEHAPYCERDFRGPSRPHVVDDGESSVVVKHHGGVTLHSFAHHPFDVVGWDGTVYPYAFSIYDFEPLVKRFHAPPSILETFTGPGWSVCSFTPRPSDFDPTSVPAPYAHSAVDCDEVMFFVSGDYTIRKGTNVGLGSLTFHPAGWMHSPHPGGSEASIGKPGHEEYAVMIDTFRPLTPGPAATLCEDPTYFSSWATHPGAGS